MSTNSLDVPSSYPPIKNNQIPLSDNARVVLEKRYLRKDANGKPQESISEMFWRVAYNVAKVEAKRKGDIETTAVKFYNLLVDLKFFPNSPTFTGAGTPLGQLAACFVLKIEDDMGKLGSGIFQTLRDAALIQQTGGGNGFSFSRLRPKHSLVNASAGEATGPVGFLRVYDKAFGEIAQGGSRRGANMAVLRVDHPDIEEFITCKTDENSITNFNISVGITDKFMRAVENNKDWDLRFPDVTSPAYAKFSGTVDQADRVGIPTKTYKTLRARDLFDKIVQQAFSNGEPGLLFIDAANRENPVPHLYELEATNPCVTGDTYVAVADGRSDVTFEDLAREGKDVPVYTRNEKGEIVVRTMRYPRRTGSKDIYEVVLEDDHVVRCTANHSFLTTSGKYVRADELCVGDVLPTLSLAKQIHAGTEFTGVIFGYSDLPAVLRVSPAGTADVYNGTVDDFHNYFVGRWQHPTNNTNNTFYQYVNTPNCGEQYLGPFENCCLGSINLAKHVTTDGKLDWESLRASVVLSTQFLDDVISANAYVPAVPELKEAALKARRIGLGIMGLGDLLFCVGIRYGSTCAEEYSAQVMEFVRYHCMLTSIEMAKSLGSFDAIAGSVYDPTNLLWKKPEPLQKYTRNFGRPEINWDTVEAGIRKFGIRNACQLTVAPTGTIATVAGCEAYGCEPVFALAYVRHVNDKGNDLTLTYTSPLFEKVLRSSGVSDSDIKEIVNEVAACGSCQNVDKVPAEVKNVFVVSQDITATEHVRMQAALQKFVDNSMSKTCNFNETATVDAVAKAYMLAWQLGCKGLTVYVAGSRKKVVLETKSTAKSIAEKEQSTSGSTKKPRPDVLEGRTMQVSTPLGKAFVTVNENGGNQPFEVFITTAKAGSETAAISEAIGRLVSYTLRLSSPVSSLDRLKEVTSQLGGIGSGRSIGFGPNRVSSMPDGVARALAHYIKDRASKVPTDNLTSTLHQPHTSLTATSHAVKIGDLCPECGEAAVVNEEGCRKCYACGHSQC